MKENTHYLDQVQWWRNFLTVPQHTRHKNCMYKQILHKIRILIHFLYLYCFLCDEFIYLNAFL